MEGLKYKSNIVEKKSYCLLKSLTSIFIGSTILYFLPINSSGFIEISIIFDWLVGFSKYFLEIYHDISVVQNVYVNVFLKKK